MLSCLFQAIAVEEKKTSELRAGYMCDIIQSFSDLFSQAIRTAFPGLGADAPTAVMTVATNPKFGDYQCNSAMGLVQVCHNLCISLSVRKCGVANENESFERAGFFAITNVNTSIISRNILERRLKIQL